ncbi:unnamed protein product [Cuscuta epithymum]|uniref:Retrotransposon Copia-like N-terminal domain-containing protein n=1 Tax=Cuscuta epithymum TaxID=186058 RepID=A0AAV0EAI8_9ASTE|nr:unnamed protein product [Cuscuta epithymum]
MTTPETETAHSNPDLRNESVRRKINDPSSPYFLHPSDSPGVNICGMTLRGESNYREWRTSMTNAFRAKRKAGFLDGTIQRPTTRAEDIEDWISVNSMLVGWIMTSIEPSLRTNITYMDDACDLWKDLKERFEVSDPIRVHEIKEALQACKQHGDSVTTYFGRLKGLWDDYEPYRNVPRCVCKGCTCNLEKQFLAKVETEKSHDFLLGLDAASFKGLRSNILSADELPPLTKLYQMVIQEERHKNLTHERTEAMALAAQMPLPRSIRDKLVCTFCKKKGHTVDNCFKKTGNYPEWWVNNPGRGRGRDGDGSGRRADKAAAHAVGTVADVIPEVQGIAPGSQHGPMISNEQWTQFLNMLNNCKVTNTTEKLSGPTYEDADWSG